jgi:uncharacterized DUF497 family protein
MTWFEWDEAKAEINRVKHGVTFEDAMLVFNDPHALAEQDRIEGAERRWQTIETVEGIILLLVGAYGARSRARRNHPYHFGQTRQPQGAEPL